MRTCPGRATLSSMNSAAAPPPYPPSSRDPGPGPPLPPPRTRELTTAQLGRLGEDLAARQLQRQGWQIIQRNLRLTQGELDIVALEATTRVLTSMKTSVVASSATLSSPLWGRRTAPRPISTCLR